MTKTDTPANDFVEIIEHKESLKGRYLKVSEIGKTYCGPIEDLRLTSKQLIVTLNRRYASRTDGDTQTWELIENTPYTYGADLDRTILRFVDDGPIDIIVMSTWIGKILPHDALQLERPTRPE